MTTGSDFTSVKSVVSEIPFSAQPDGWLVLYRAERPAECRNVEQAIEDIEPGGSRDRWYTPNLAYAKDHLAPQTLANLTRSLLDIPFEQKPITNPEKYGADAKWRIKALALPADVARRFWCENSFERLDDGKWAVLRKVDWKGRRALRAYWRASMRLGGMRLAVHLLPRDIIDQAATLIEAGHREAWDWAVSYVERDRKPVPPQSAFIDVSVDELTAWGSEPQPQPIEVLEIVRPDKPAEWYDSVTLEFPNLSEQGPLGLPWFAWLDGQDFGEFKQLAKEVSAALEKRRR